MLTEGSALLHRKPGGSGAGSAVGGSVGSKWPVLIFAGCAALNSCNLGYDIGVSGSVGKLLQEEFSLHNKQTGLFIGFINIWSIPGALASSALQDWAGRRRMFAIAALFFEVCSLTPTITIHVTIALALALALTLARALALRPASSRWRSHPASPSSCSAARSSAWA
jgi:MFS family permease